MTTRKHHICLWMAFAVVALPVDGHCADPNGGATACEELRNADFSTILDAPTQITDAKLVEAKNDLPAHCDVQGYVSPNVGIALLLPIKKWNGKLIEVGCGGLCGVIPTSGACSNALSRGYACIGSDGGHQSTVRDAKWAYNNLQAEIDFGYRSVHVTALAGKAMVEHYYGVPPNRAYFMGCSNGGRQGLVEAQRFPFDFDGIVAMEPSLNASAVLMTMLWNALAVRTEDGKPIFAARDVDVIHNAIVAKCDLNDGIQDGLIGDPRSCSFDPSELSCKQGDNDRCLTQGQVEAARKVYSGPTTSKGERITRRGAMLGSEIGGTIGISSYLSGADTPGTLTVSTEFFRYLGFSPDPGPRWKAKDFNFDRDYKRLGMMESLYASTDPDLRRFKARGGKLIVIQGLHDNGLPASITLKRSRGPWVVQMLPATSSDCF